MPRLLCSLLWRAAAAAPAMAAPAAPCRCCRCCRRSHRLTTVDRVPPSRSAPPPPPPPPAEDQLQRLPAEVPPPPAAQSQGEQEGEEEGEGELNFLALRQRAAEWMRAHADEFEPFVLPVSEAGGRGLSCRGGVCVGSAAGEEVPVDFEASTPFSVGEIGRDCAAGEAGRVPPGWKVPPLACRLRRSFVPACCRCRCRRASSTRHATICRRTLPAPRGTASARLRPTALRWRARQPGVGRWSCRWAFSEAAHVWVCGVWGVGCRQASGSTDGLPGRWG